MRKGYTRSIPRVAAYDRHRVGSFKKVRGRPLRDHKGGPQLVVPLRKGGGKRRKSDPLLLAYRRAMHILRGGDEDAVEE